MFLTNLTPKPLESAVGFEQASLTFVCKKIYAHRMLREEIPEDVRERLYGKDNPLHYVFMGEIVDAFGQIDE